jgi:hypothetical protein
MSVADIKATWYANNTRVVVTDADGLEWRVVPDEFSSYIAINDDGIAPRRGVDMADVLAQVLGKYAHLVGVR